MYSMYTVPLSNTNDCVAQVSLDCPHHNLLYQVNQDWDHDFLISSELRQIPQNLHLHVPTAR